MAEHHVMHSLFYSNNNTLCIICFIVTNLAVMYGLCAMTKSQTEHLVEKPCYHGNNASSKTMGHALLRALTVKQSEYLIYIMMLQLQCRLWLLRI